MIQRPSLRTFGEDISPSDDGKRMAILTENPAIVQVFQLDEETQLWSQLGQTITKATSNRVKISGDGTRVIVPTVVEDTVRIYELNSSSLWSQVGDDINGGFVSSVMAINFDGSRIIFVDDSSVIVQVFDYDSVQNQWNPQNSPPSATVTTPQVEMTADGNHIIMQKSDATIGVFSFVGGSWTQIGDEFSASVFLGGVTEEAFGRRLDIVKTAADELIVAFPGCGPVNPPFADPDACRIHVYKFVDSVWEEFGNKILGTRSFGNEVSLSSTGMRIAVSTHGFLRDGGSGIHSGLFSVFEYQEFIGDWTKVTKDMAGLMAHDGSLHVDLVKNGTRLAQSPRGPLGSFGVVFSVAGYVRVFDLETEP